MGSEWKESTVGEQFDLANGFAFKSKDFLESGVPVIKIKNVKAGFFSEHNFSYVSPEFINTRKDKLARVDDLLISMSGNRHDGSPETWVGKVARFNKTSEYFINQRVGALRVKDETEVNPRFASYLLSSWDYQQLFISIATSSGGQANLSPGQILGAPFEFPPLPEQKAIAHILGSLDDKIELNRQMNEMLEGIAQALFKSWFVDFDPVIDNILAKNLAKPSPNLSRGERDGTSPSGRSGDEGSIFDGIPEEFAARAETRRKALANGTANREAAKNFPASFIETDEMGWIPEGWEVSTFGEVSTCFDRKRIPLSKKQREEKKPGHIPYYGATSVMDYIDEWIFDDTYLLIGEDGSVMKEDGSPFVQYIWGKTWVNNHAHVLQGASGISTEHLMLFMLSQNITAYVTGAVQLKINQKNMNSIPFLKASDEINRQFSDCISPSYERIKQLAEEVKTLSKLRDTLLPKLISGELRIEDAEKMVGVA